MEQALVDFFLNTQSHIVELETIEISHPAFSQTYFCVRNAVDGIVVKLENGQEVFFEYYPMQIENSGVRDDLDQSLKITFGDVGEILPLEIDRITQADGFKIRPIIKYRTYRSDDLSKPMYGPVILEVAEMPFSKEGVSFEAKAPSLNINATGELYKMDRFPMLRGLL